jgi:protein-tyrosine phosphatase
MERTKILFVCAGNICRSPLAEGIFRHLATRAGRAADIEIDSAGTGAWHQGQPADHRSVAVAADNGIDISTLRARQVTARDFGHFDLILAMDRDNLRSLRARAPSTSTAAIELFSLFASETDCDIPDPYFGSRRDFQTVYIMLFAGCSALLAKIGNPLPSCNGNTSSVR